MAQKPTPQNGGSGMSIEVVDKIKSRSLPDGYKPIRREAIVEPAVITNIPQSVLVAAADKVMKTDFDRAYVHDGKIIVLQ